MLAEDREVQFQIDPGAARLGQRRLDRWLSSADEGAPSHLAHGQPAPDQLAVHPRCGRRGDGVSLGEAALRRQSIAGLQTASRDVRRQDVGDYSVVVHRASIYCTESIFVIALTYCAG